MVENGFKNPVGKKKKKSRGNKKSKLGERVRLGRTTWCPHFSIRGSKKVLCTAQKEENSEVSINDNY